MTSEHVRRVQDRRRSGAAGPHDRARARAAEEREAIEDQQENTAHDDEAEDDEAEDDENEDEPAQPLTER